MQFSMAQKKLRLEQTLKQVGGSPTRAAKELGVSRATVYRWMRELGMSSERE